MVVSLSFHSPKMIPIDAVPVFAKKIGKMGVDNINDTLRYGNNYFKISK